MNTKIIRYIGILISLMVIPIFMTAQSGDAKSTAASNSGFMFDMDSALYAIAATLGIAIIVLIGLMKSAIKYHFKNKMGGHSSKTILLLIASCFGFESYAQTTAPAQSEQLFFSPQGWMMLIIIAVEIFIIIYLVKWIKQFTGLSAIEQKERQKTKSLWDRMNAFKSIDEEGIIDTGHNYDGIRELDNDTPPWFTAAFIGTIVFAVVYMYRYHVAESAPLMIDEFKMEMALADAEKLEFLKSQANAIDENTVVQLEEGQYEEGKAIFKTACAVCHGDLGQGTVGPNLTDEYWLHGGSIKDIFTVIKYGVIDKGMKPWKDDYSPNQIAQLTTFIKKLSGTNPPNPKEAQGEKYKEETASTQTDSTSVDSTGVK